VTICDLSDSPAVAFEIRSAAVGNQPRLQSNGGGVHGSLGSLGSFILASSSALLLSVVVARAGGCAPGGVEHVESRTSAVSAGANPGNLDILFMIDNSSSMTQIQQKLLDQDPSFMTVLENLPNGLPNIHVAVVSSDMGAPGDSTMESNARRSATMASFNRRRAGCARPARSRPAPAAPLRPARPARAPAAPLRPARLAPVPAAPLVTARPAATAARAPARGGPPPARAAAVAAATPAVRQ
jgi:hypothetical protein